MPMQIRFDLQISQYKTELGHMKLTLTNLTITFN